MILFVKWAEEFFPSFNKEASDGEHFQLIESLLII